MRNHRHIVVATLLLLTGVAGCQKGSKDKDTKDKPVAGQGSGSGAGMAAGSGSGSGSAAPAPEAKDLDSKDILARTETATEVHVKHVLLAWNGMAVPRGQLDPRAAKRSNT